MCTAETGGLSGLPLKDMSTEGQPLSCVFWSHTLPVIRKVYKLTGGKLPLVALMPSPLLVFLTSCSQIGVGGVGTGQVVGQHAVAEGMT